MKTSPACGFRRDAFQLIGVTSPVGQRKWIQLTDRRNAKPYDWGLGLDGIMLFVELFLGRVEIGCRFPGEGKVVCSKDS